jgi:hypothetical protein
MFGFVTKTQLEAHADELRRELAAARDDQAMVLKRIKLEWEEWWEKYSRLYARLSKRVKDAERADLSSGGADGSGDRAPAPETPAPVNPAKLATWRARRGF